MRPRSLALILSICCVATACRQIASYDIARDDARAADAGQADTSPLDAPSPADLSADRRDMFGDTATPDLPVPDLPTPVPDLPTPDLPAPDLPAPDLPTPDLPAPDLPPPDLSTPDLSGPPSWTLVNPSPTIANLYAVTGLASANSVSEVMAVGASGTTLRWEPGKSWTAETSCTTKTLRAVTVHQGLYVAAGDEAAICQRNSKGAWKGLLPISALPQSRVHGLASFSSELAAVGRSGLTDDSGLLRVYNGWTWQTPPVPGLTGLRGAAQVSSTVAIVGAKSGGWVREAVSPWSKATGAQLASDVLGGVWGRTKGSAVEFWVAIDRGSSGALGKITFDNFNGGWELAIYCSQANNSNGALVAMKPLHAVHGDLGTGAIWAVGDEGFVLRLQQGTCEDVSPPQLTASAKSLHGVWAAAGKVYVVGDGGTILVR